MESGYQARSLLILWKRIVSRLRRVKWLIKTTRKVRRAGPLLLPFLWLALADAATAQVKLNWPGAVYSNTALRFRYRLPGGMNDKTQSGREEIRTRAAEHHVTDTFELLLGMTSGADDSASTWRSLAIETYPRTAFGNLDDTSAEAKMNAWVMGISSSTEKPRSVILGGQSFAVSVFREQEGAITKGAAVWTTVRKNKLLSFAFVANSPEQLQRLTESMKSLKFF